MLPTTEDKRKFYQQAFHRVTRCACASAFQITDYKEKCSVCALREVAQVAGVALHPDGQLAHALLGAHRRRALLRYDQVHLQRRLVRRALRARAFVKCAVPKAHTAMLQSASMSRACAIDLARHPLSSRAVAA